MNSKFAIRNILIASAVIAALVFMVWKIQRDWTFSEFPQTPYIGAQWRAARDEGGRTVRSNMIEDLLKTHNFKGWACAEVIAELGEPYPGPVPPYDMLILIGPDRGFGIDIEFIAFQLDSDDRVTSYDLIQL